jgi:hypothetical protein
MTTRRDPGSVASSRQFGDGIKPLLSYGYRIRPVDGLPGPPAGPRGAPTGIAVSSEDLGSGRVVVLVLPAVNLLDLAGPVQAFDAAAHRGGGYRLEFVAAEPGEVKVRSASGMVQPQRRRAG